MRETRREKEKEMREGGARKRDKGTWRGTGRGRGRGTGRGSGRGMGNDGEILSLAPKTAGRGAGIGACVEGTRSGQGKRGGREHGMVSYTDACTPMHIQKYAKICKYMHTLREYA